MKNDQLACLCLSIILAGSLIADQLILSVVLIFALAAAFYNLKGD